MSDRFQAFILGAAVGDAIGLPREGLSARRARKMFGSAPLTHRLCCERGLVSDDTEHLVMTGLALLDEPADDAAFACNLARRLKYWLLRLPAGVGLATLRSILKLWLGWRPDSSGVISAGNGPAMRSGIIGLCLSGDQERLLRFTRASTRLTHRDPKAEVGALAISWAAAFAVRTPITADSTRQLIDELKSLSHDQEWTSRCELIAECLRRGDSVEQFAAASKLEWGVRGYIYETVQVALFCWLSSPHDFQHAVENAVLLGGDTDTVGAIVGGLAGLTAGASDIPVAWLTHLSDWPLSRSWLVKLSEQLATQIEASRPLTIPLRYPAIRSLPRNLVFLGIVLAHGFRRLLPPY